MKGEGVDGVSFLKFFFKDDPSLPLSQIFLSKWLLEIKEGDRKGD